MPERQRHRHPKCTRAHTTPGSYTTPRWEFGVKTPNCREQPPCACSAKVKIVGPLRTRRFTLHALQPQLIGFCMCFLTVIRAPYNSREQHSPQINALSHGRRLP
jgi:hypothetical protein